MKKACKRELKNKISSLLEEITDQFSKAVVKYLCYLVNICYDHKI